MIVPAKIAPVVVDQFAQLLTLCLTSFILLMYIPLLYRTVYRIVAEKMTKAKESMRMMGMTDLPYWTSWFVYYTIVNTVIVTIAWAVLLINVFRL